MTLSAYRVLQSAREAWASGALMSALELGVFTELGRGPRTRAQLQRRLELEEGGAADFLDALVGLGWLEREGDDTEAVYVNSRDAGHFLDRRSPAYLGDWLQAQFAPLTDRRGGLAALLRAGRPADPARPSAHGIGRAWGLLVADSLSESVDLRRFTRLLDLRGGAAHLACGLATEHPQLRAVIARRPAGVTDAIGTVDGARLSGRVQVRSIGDGPLPTDAAEWPRSDLVLLDFTQHPADRPTRLALLRAACAALEPGGIAVLVDHLLDDARRRCATALLLSLSRRLGGDRTGAPHYAGVARADCLDAGFARVEPLMLAGGMADALVAYR